MTLLPGYVHTHLTDSQSGQHIPYFIKANTVRFISLKPGTSQKVQNIANRLWLSGTLFSITHAVFKVGSPCTSPALRVTLNVWTQAGRLTKEAREIRGLDEKNVGGDNARETRLKALQT